MLQKLTMLIGRSGSGKSHALLERLGALSRAGKDKLFLLVPEQYSFVSERALLKALSPAEAARVQVLSFTRLADTVFRETGGVAKEPLDEGMRALLMSRALEELCTAAADDDTLPAPRRQLHTDPVYITQLLAILEELRQCAIPTQALEELTTTLEAIRAGSTTAEKTRELYHILSVYEGLASTCGIDELDTLSALADKLPQSQLPEDAVVMVDGFKGFTAQELRVLEALLPRVAEMTVALSTDTPGVGWSREMEHSREYTLFSPVTYTIEQLRRIGDNHGCTWELCLLPDNRRNNGALATLEAGLYAPAPQVYEEETQAVTLTPCRDVYEECAYVARQVRRLLREEGYRCRDIVLVARQLDAYTGIVEDALAEQGIPCFTDGRQELLCEPLIAYVRSALRLAIGGWKTEEILRLLKTDLTPLSPLDTARLENYVYMWSVDGAAWSAPFTENPAGLGASVTPYTARELAQLNTWREQILAPIEALSQALRGKPNGRTFALAVYRFLTTDRELPRRIAQRTDALEKLAEPTLAAHVARLWDELMGVLDRFATILADQPMAATRLEELWAMLLQMLDIGKIPPALDAVTLGSANRIRYDRPKAVFILGANEGVFPAYPESDGILTEEDRHLWEQAGIELSGDMLRRSMEERYYVYMAVAAPRERLTVSYLAGGDNAPSPLVEQISRILPGCRRQRATQPDGRDLESAEDMFQRLAELLPTPGPVQTSLQQVVEGLPAYAGRLAAVRRSEERAPFRLEEPALATGLFGRDMCLSATQTEKFYTCHFAYFCRYGLGVRPRKVAKVDAALFGTVVHYVMETLLPTYTQPQGLIEELKARDAAASAEEREAAENAVQDDLNRRLREDIDTAVDAYVEKVLGGQDNRTGLFLYQLQLAKQAAYNMLWHTVMELRQSAFQPVDYELAILPDPAQPEQDGVLSIRLPFTGGQVRFIGKIDRVDLYVRFDGTAFVRVIDYKTGSKTFDLQELTAGLSTQLLLYLFILCENSRRYLESQGELHPAGVLYHPLSDMYISRSEQNAQTARLKSMSMNGLVLDDPGVIQAMEKAGEKVFIPAGIGRDGRASGNVITPQQFALLRGVVEKLLTGMAESLLAGDITAMPLERDGRTSPCTYCDYRPICCHEEDDPCRRLSQRSMATVLEALENAEEVSAHG